MLPIYYYINSFKLFPLLLLTLCCSCASKQFFAASPLYFPPPTSELSDSATVQAGKHYKRNGLYTLIFGKHYRRVWVTPVKVRVLKLHQEKGGLTIMKEGGSKQTTSYTLQDSTRKLYALRSVDKDPSGTLHPFLQKTWAADFIRDQTAALNPYAALVVAPLAQASGIIQASPELVYLPKEDLIMSSFNKKAGDRLYLLEEKIAENELSLRELGDSIGTISSKKMLKKLRASSAHIPDEVAYAKARLFDIFINDRDRHEDQWDWAILKNNGKTVFSPIPKDRDQAFYNYADGVLPFVVGRALNYQKFISFEEKYPPFASLTAKSYTLDAYLLAGLTQAQLNLIVQEMQDALSDEVIEKAVRQFPDEVYRNIGEQMIYKLKKRRDSLPLISQKLYAQLAKEPLVYGTDEEEIFQVNRLNDQQTEVTVLNKASGQILFNRTYNHSETKKIRIFGFSGDDVFKIQGKTEKGLLLQLAGGKGNDLIQDISYVKGIRKSTHFFESKKDTIQIKGSETRFRSRKLSL